MNESPNSTQPPADGMEVEVFRTGDYGPKGTWAEEDLERIAGAYDPALHEAPVTLDHRQDGPSEGWIRGLRRVGDRLVATLHRLSPGLRDLLARGAYRKRSVELYRSFGPGGGPYLKALSFLGAAAPEVKGLTDPIFAETVREVVRFDEAPEAQGSDPRTELMARGRWNPAWDDAGLAEVFAALAEPRLCAMLVEALALGPPEVSFGREGRSSPARADPGHAPFHGTPSAGSIALHERALRMTRENPALEYREALLLASR